MNPENDVWKKQPKSIQDYDLTCLLKTGKYSIPCWEVLIYAVKLIFKKEEYY